MPVEVDSSTLQSVLGHMLDAFCHPSVTGLSTLLETPDAKKAIDAIRRDDFDGFYFALQHPANDAIHAILAQEIPPEQHEVQFLFRECRFVMAHVRRLIERQEGFSCCVDKARTVLAAYLRHLRTGQEVAFNRQQAYTFHIPTRVFCDHVTTVDFMRSLHHLLHGNPDPYLLALQAMLEGARALDAPSSENIPT